MQTVGITMYEQVGGEAAVNKLVDDFYRIMSTDPKAARCLATHGGKDIRESAQKLKYFLSGWLGGPQLYVENFGHPRLRLRHLPFAISRVEAGEWLYCMEEALKLSSIPHEIQAQMMQAFAGVAKMVMNRE